MPDQILKSLSLYQYPIEEILSYEPDQLERDYTQISKLSHLA